MTGSLRAIDRIRFNRHCHYHVHLQQNGALRKMSSIATLVTLSELCQLPDDGVKVEVYLDDFRSTIHGRHAGRRLAQHRFACTSLHPHLHALHSNVVPESSLVNSPPKTRSRLLLPPPPTMTTRTKWRKTHLSWERQSAIWFWIPRRRCGRWRFRWCGAGR
jgi:hypothetical protein